MQQQLRHVSRKAMHVVPRLRKVAPRELVRLDEREDLRVNGGAQRLDRVPHKRVAALLVAVQIADRKAQALRRERLGQPSSLNDVGIVQHCIDRVRGVLVSEERRAFIPLSEAQPRARQIAILSLPQSGVAECPPIGRGGPAFDNHDFGDASGRIQFDVPFLEFALARPGVGNGRIQFRIDLRPARSLARSSPGPPRIARE